MNEIELKNGVIFPIGKKLESENFNGTVWLNMLTPAGSALPIGNVTFEPGCRNNWHKHAGGQVLLVTGGRGYYQEWDKPARKLRPGDVVEIPADVKHWHGAARDSWFAHIAIEVHPEKGPAVWMEPVTDQIYNALD
jgi:quercetin dioxygenase-like cupin family protein